MIEYTCKAKTLFINNEDSKWIEGYLLSSGDGDYYIAEPSSVAKGLDVNGWIDGMQTYQVDRETICRSTGLRDKNKKQIFENDILMFGDNKLVVWWNPENFRWEAKKGRYPCISFDPHNISYYKWDWDNIDLGVIASEIPVMGRMTTEVIGNICDDPLFWAKEHEIVNVNNVQIEW